MSSVHLFATETERSMGARIGDVTTPSGVADTLARYRYLVQVASAETISRAIEEALSRLDWAGRSRVIALLRSAARARSWPDRTAARGTSDLCRFAAEAEAKEPGALERFLASGVAGPRDDRLWLSFASRFVTSECALACFDHLRERGGSGGWETSGGPGQRHLERDPDFADEFGYESGFAGGAGFENVDFDKWV